MKTLKNKLAAIGLLAAGSLGIIFEGDATALVLFSFIALPMFFSKESWFEN